MYSHRGIRRIKNAFIITIIIILSDLSRLGQASPDPLQLTSVLAVCGSLAVSGSLAVCGSLVVGSLFSVALVTAPISLGAGPLRRHSL